jgi:hypothetical protein
MSKDLFRTELRQLINRFSIDNESNTPDFLLAQYLMRCLSAYEETIQGTNLWNGNKQ